jgi:single-strand DNA-binding protein
MASLAKMLLVGNLGRDADLRYTPKGTAVLEFSLATNERWTDAGGAQQELTQWFRVTVWGRQAESLKPFLVKGKQVFVEGRFRSREYTDRDGKHRVSLEVRSDQLLLLGARGAAPEETPTAPPELEREDQSFENTDDIPF